ncbi:MAG: hypothetical protein L0Z50_13840, partial [Verrucomicrobiales bacterium]|nr:hypothetical protein [Verrucomicrobiales bacterium]
MNRQKQRGVALVITLLMLSVVTFMAVVFLAVSRREKAAVVASSDLTDAKLMADAGLARAQGEVLSHILATTNVGAYDFLVSTNYMGGLGYFRPQAQAVVNVTNVGFWLQGQNPDLVKPIANKLNRLQAIANLQYDARPPVFIRTNFTMAANNPNAWDFRFFLDLNRNGLFEDTGAGSFSERGRTNAIALVGDPQWIGILEHPDRPHSETNRFIGRYAFQVLPTGKSLSLNSVHNYAKRIRADMSAEGFSRNQGVGSWELNLAAFLADLNTNIWNSAVFGGVYRFDARPNFASLGKAFVDANQILKFRYDGRYDKLLTAEQYFGFPAAPNNPFAVDKINSYSDFPMAPVDMDVDVTTRPWAGSDSTNVLFDAQELYSSGLLPADTVDRLRLLSKDRSSQSSLYNRYTFYRLLAQMGVDSRPALSNRLFQTDFDLHPTNKFNLNYQPSGGEDQRRGLAWRHELDWSPTRAGNASTFFHLVADRLLRASLTTNVLADSAGRPRMAFALGATPVRRDISVTNIQIFPPTTARQHSQWETNVEYTASLHRVLQVAANIYDATTSRRIGVGTNAMEYPTVFRPLFWRGSEGEILIAGFAEVTNSLPVRNAWLDISIPSERLKISTDPNRPSGFNIFGVPWVIGAKKGWPNFNEFSLETAVQVIRKLAIRRLAGRTFLTNQMYVIGVSNIFGVEAWNSYAQALSRPLEVYVTNRYSFSLSNVVDNAARLVLLRFGATGRVMTNSAWMGMASPESYLLPIHT